MSTRLAFLLSVIFALLLVAVVLAIPAIAGEPTSADPSVSLSSAYYFHWDFEVDGGGFIPHSGGEWEWGTPLFPSGIVAHSGGNVWGTDLDDEADDDVGQHVLTRTITLPTDPTGVFLEWWDWYADESGDERQLWIGNTQVWDDSGGTDQRYWVYHAVDLSTWAGQTVDIVFLLDVCCGGHGPDGWYIDDVGIRGDIPVYDGSTKSASPVELAYPGQRLTYTLVISNRGTLTGTHTYLSDTLPSGTLYVPGSIDVQGGGTVTTTPSAVEWGGAVGAGERVTLTFAVTVTASEGVLTNTALITDPRAITPVFVTVVNRLPLLSLRETFNRDTLPPGWVNDTGDSGEDWKIGAWADYGASYDYTSGSGNFAWLDDSTPHYTPTNLLSPYVDLMHYADPQLVFAVWNRRILTEPVTALHVDIYDDTSWITDVAVLDIPYTGWTRYRIDLSSYKYPVARIRFRGVETSGFESDLCLDDVQIVERAPDFHGSRKTVYPDQVAIGGQLTYTIRILNSGSLTSTAGRMFDRLPPGLELAGVSLDGPGLLSSGPDWIEWTTTPSHELAPDDSVTLTVVATATEGLTCGVPFTNTASISDALGYEETILTSPPASPYFDVYLFEDFEADDGGFIPDPGSEWEWGVPQTANDAPPAAYSGDRLWGTNLAGDIPTEPSTHLLTWTLTLPSDPKGLYLHWRDWWHGDGADEGRIRVNGRSVYDVDTNQAYWAEHVADLSRWEGDEVEIVFQYLADGASDGGAGWFIDSVGIHSICPMVTLEPDFAGTICPGSTAIYTLTAFHANDVPDLIDVSWTATAWPTTVTPTLLSLGTHDAADVVVTIDVDWLLPPGVTDVFTVTARAQTSGLQDRARIEDTTTIAAGWGERAAPLISVRHHAVVYEGGGLFQIGGHDGEGPHGGVYRYDIAGDTWISLTNLITPVYYVDGAAIDGRIYIPGGRTASSGDSDGLQVYSPTLDAWSTGAPLPESVSYHEVAAVGGKLYVLGGRSTGSVQIYDPATDAWSLGTPMTIPVRYAASGVIDGRIYLAGGYNDDSREDQSALQIYDPASDTWSYGASMPTTWIQAADGVLDDRYLILVGGDPDRPWASSEEGWAYDAQQDVWFPLPDTEASRNGAEGDTGQGRFYCLGGHAGGYVRNHEWLVPCPPCVAPAVTLSHYPALPLPGETVAFTATLWAGSAPLSYTWDFGDDQGADGKAVTHTYATTGTYSVVLTTTNACGTDVDTVDVTVSQSTPPTADFHSNAPVELGQPMHFLNLSQGSAPLFYHWDFGDGAGTSTALNPTYYYTHAGTFPVTLVVTNPYGMDDVTYDVAVLGEPLCDFTAVPNPAGVEEPVHFTNLTQGTQPISYTWHFGDGGFSTDESPIHAYTSVGTYTTWLTATNDWGSDACTHTVAVQPLPPTANFDASCPHPLGQTTHFTNTSTGSRPFTGLLWQFGDGSAPATVEHPSHTYATTGTYTVTLHVTNTYGSDVTQGVCTVEFFCRPLTGVSFTYRPSPIHTGQVVTFTASYIPVTATAPVSISWDFGDGGVASGPEVTHTFTATGSYSVTVMAGNCGGERSFRRILRVAEAWLYLPVVLRNN